MIPILDWIFEGIIGWIAGIVSSLMDAVSGLFLKALGTSMVAMEEYFPCVTKAYFIMQNFKMQDTEISGGYLTVKATGADGRTDSVEMFSAAQFEHPEGPHGVVTASDGSQWYQIASGEGKGVFYDVPAFGGGDSDSAAETARIASVWFGV